VNLKQLRLNALRRYLPVRSKTRRKKKPAIEAYMGIFGEASPGELDKYALELWFFG